MDLDARLGFARSRRHFPNKLFLKLSHQPQKRTRPEKLPAWFFRILKNTLIDEFRKLKRDIEKSKEYQRDVLPDLESQIEEKLCECVKHLILDLSPEEQLILEKHFFEGKKFQDLSQEFGQSEGTIRVKATRARKKLKELFRDCCNITRFDQTKDCSCG